MSIKAALSIPFAKVISASIRKAHKNPVKTQLNVFTYLIREAKNTQFGRDHGFAKITNYEDFKQRVPIRDYEGIKSYITEIKEGKSDVLWKGKPAYFCKTSGTTSGTKYIPISTESIKNQIRCARNAILLYINETGTTNFVNGKMIFLQGSPELDESGEIPIGRLSGIVAHHVPAYLQKNRLPSFKTNCIEDWETKVDAVVEETVHQPMSLISGIPPWVQMYFDKLLEKTGKKTIKEVFPDFSLFIHGGVNFEPYRQRFEETIGKRIATIETYPASEGFIAYQDSQKEKGLLLAINDGIFYEFIPADEFFNETPKRLSLVDVKLGVNYVLILNTNAGLWGYNIGDTVKFVSLKPHRIIVSGRIKHFISAFGEHVIGEEVDYAIRTAAEKFGAELTEFHVAPQVAPIDGETAYHEWFIEFSKEPQDIKKFSKEVDELLQQKNTYYRDLREGTMLQELKIRILKKESFILYMKSEGKLGGQNKVPRLANDRKIADSLIPYRL